jgi:predicted nucleotidyltransferase
MINEQTLTDLATKLKSAAEANLVAVILYGSAATDEFHEGHSDVNILCIVKNLGSAELAKLHEPSAWWVKQGHPAPLYLTHDELRRSADIFAIEFLDIQATHRLLHGEDLMSGLEIPMDRHRLQVERELRNNTLRLRQRFLAHPTDDKKTLELMTSSISSFAALFRHALIVLGEEPPTAKRDAVTRLGRALGFDPAPFQSILDVREGRKRAGDLDVRATFGAYLERVAQVTDEVDRRLDVSTV